MMQGGEAIGSRVNIHRAAEAYRDKNIYNGVPVFYGRTKEEVTTLMTDAQGL
jgi:hypothetical protein